MKRAEITPGVVYAYQDSTNGTPVQIVFLAPLDSGHLYKVNPQRGEGDRMFVHDPSADKPGKARYGYPSTGFLAAIGKDVSGATLEEATAPRTGTGNPERRPYRYTLMKQMTKVISIYAGVMAARDAEEQARASDKAAREAANEAYSARMLALSGRLSELGFPLNLRDVRGNDWRDTEYDRKSNPPRYCRLNIEGMTDLIALIEGLNAMKDDAQGEGQG